MSETFLPVATPNDLPVGSTTVPVSEAVAALADVLSTDGGDPTQVRIGTVTSISDPNSSGRVQLDITSTSWCSRSADISLRVGDRVCVLQQGPVFIVIARIGASETVPIGGLVPFAGSTAPLGWLITDGSSLLRASYPALFAVIGTTYGAADGTHFNIPNVVNRVPVGSGGSYSRGATGGASTVTLSTGQIPGHDHGGVGDHSHSMSGTANSVGDHSHGYTNASSTRGDLLASGGSSANNSSFGDSTSGAGGHSHSLSGSIGSGGSHTHSSVGGGGSHENMPPFIAMPYIIRAL